MVRSASNCRSAEKGSSGGNQDDHDVCVQQLDISEQNYRDLNLAGVGKTLKKRGRKPGSTTEADSTPRKRRPRQNRKPAVTA